MNRLRFRQHGLVACAFAFSTLALAQVRAQDPSPTEELTPMTARAQGTFDVDLKPLTEDEGWGGFGRMSIDKRFHGDLVGQGKGVMLSAQTEVEGSAGYVALERVTATLDGRSGTFVLQHTGLMGRGEQSLTIAVVTDSGTDELKGISGTLEIRYEKEGRTYVFDYSLPS